MAPTTKRVTPAELPPRVLDSTAINTPICSPIATPALELPCRPVIGGKEAFDADLLQRHILRRAQGRDRGEEAQREIIPAEMDGDHRRAGLRSEEHTSELQSRE